ncbi:dienelactone hydrolase family protein [Cochlodiniinecator piscidefendens]|uniref:alpha/beta hydrolase n=1 Tax=Cochlodiniinecator piscidefendens TaxID=2715756 RepID=UPI00140AF10F|nr:alpha/beta hydrolase [Cochlodiniinecator piscidefendens]
MKFFVVSDIFGQPDAENCVLSQIPKIAGVERHSLAQLCGRPELTGEGLHVHLFRENGMQRAVASLMERRLDGCIGMGYSAGGTVLWQAVGLGLRLDRLYCISSTRLRNEAAVSIPNHVFFGGNDPAKPTATWLGSIPLQSTVFPGLEHDFYRDPLRPECGQIRQQIKSDLGRADPQ